jgi:hypothetical protein
MSPVLWAVLCLVNQGKTWRIAVNLYALVQAPVNQLIHQFLSISNDGYASKSYCQFETDLYGIHFHKKSRLLASGFSSL